MSTSAQISANQKNAQNSSGPKTEEGKATSSLNNLRHGFTGTFIVLKWENQDDFALLRIALQAEHKPQTPTESVLVEKMAQHQWLTQRALTLQDMTFHPELPVCEAEKQLALYLRYQTTHDRAFHKCLDQLLKLKAEKRKAEIGFESQRLKQAEQARQESVEKRKQDLHKIDVLLAEAKLDHQVQQTMNLEFAGKLAAIRENQQDGVKKAA